VLGSTLAHEYQSASFTRGADKAVMFLRSINDRFRALSSFLTAVGPIAMLWFLLGLALLLRRCHGELPWRSAMATGTGAVTVCPP
jgi:hypothetical protein